MAGTVKFVIFLNVLAVSHSLFDNMIDEDFVESKHYVFWPNATVPFYIDPQHFDHEQSLAIMRALTLFGFRTCIKFQPTLVRPDTKHHVMVFENPEGIRKCYIDNKGYSVDGPHRVILGYDCLTSPNIDMMIMKNLGFPFEHNRQVRDLFITVQMENVNPLAFELFTKDTKLPAELRSLPYDVDSVMHFDVRQFSKNGHRTIIFKDLRTVQDRKGLSPIDVRKIATVYGPECRKRDRQEQVELCQNYPGVARRKRDVNEHTAVTEKLSADATVNLRVNRDITPPPDDSQSQEDVSIALRELGIEAQVEEVIDHVHKVTALALKNARLKYCNNTKVPLRDGPEIVKSNKSDILEIVANIADYAKGMVARATNNLTAFCEDSQSIEVYQRDSCPFFNKNRCPKTYRSTKSGPVKYSTQHRPVYQQSTKHWDLKKNWLRDGNDTQNEQEPQPQEEPKEAAVNASETKSRRKRNIGSESPLDITTPLAVSKSASSEAKVASSEVKVAESEAKVAPSEVKVAESEAKVGTNEVKVAESEAKVDTSEVKVAESEAKVASSEVKVASSEAKVAANEATVAPSEVKVASSEAKVAASEATVTPSVTKTDEKDNVVSRDDIKAVDKVKVAVSQAKDALSGLNEALKSEAASINAKFDARHNRRKAYIDDEAQPTSGQSSSETRHTIYKRSRTEDYYDDHENKEDSRQKAPENSRKPKPAKEYEDGENQDPAREESQEEQEEREGRQKAPKRSGKRKPAQEYEDAEGQDPDPEREEPQEEQQEQRTTKSPKSPKKKKSPRKQKNFDNDVEAETKDPEHQLKARPRPRTVRLSDKNKEFYGDRRWPSGVVPYVIADGPDYNKNEVRARIEEVNAILKEKTCARLQEITEDEATNYQDYIVLNTSPDYVTGHVGGRQQFGVTELFKGGQHRQHGAMMVMAMLGFYFEVARHDRDQHIRVHTRHIRPDKLHHFEKIRDDATFPLPYDHKSATHPAWQFWREIGRTGISTVATYKQQDPDGTLMKSLGQNEELLSELDLVKINSVYGTRCFGKPKAKRADPLNDRR